MNLLTIKNVKKERTASTAPGLIGAVVMTEVYVMRRTEREMTDQTEICSFLASQHILRVAFYDSGELYIVPVNYGYSYANGHYSFYFHGAKAGRKYELSKGQPSVGFEIDGRYQVLAGKTACNYSAAFQSVIGTGTLHLAEDPSEKRKGLDLIMRQATQTADWDYADAALEAVAVFRIDVAQLSCKAHDPAITQNLS